MHKNIVTKTVKTPAK